MKPKATERTGPVTDSDPVLLQPDEDRFGVRRWAWASSWRGRRFGRQAMRCFIALLAFVMLFYWFGQIGNLSLHRPFSYSGDALEMLSYQTHDYIANDFDTRMRAPFELSKPENGRYLYNALFQSNSNLMWIAKWLVGVGGAWTFIWVYLFSFFWSSCRGIGYVVVSGCASLFGFVRQV